MSTECSHDQMTSTFARGVYCCQCDEPLVGFFWPVSRNTPAGAMLYALRNQLPQKEQPHDPR